MKWFWNQGRIERDPLAKQREQQLANKPSIEKIWDSALTEAEYFVIDIETSGFSATKDLVLSLAAGCMRGNKLPLDPLYYKIIRHEHVEQIPKHIWELTGLSEIDIQNGDEWRDVLFKALDLSVNRVWIAHHARHELSFIEKYVKQFWKIHLRPIVIDTSIVAQVLCKLQNPPTLDFVCEWLGVNIENRHCADADIKMTAEVWQKEMALCQQLGLETVSDVVEWSISQG